MVSFAMHVTLLAARTSIILLAACSNMMQPLMNKHAGNTTDEATACLSVHCMGGNTQEIHFCRSALRSHFCVRSGALTSNVRSGDRMALYIEVTSEQKSLLQFEVTSNVRNWTSTVEVRPVRSETSMFDVDFSV
eukprot:CAMPEP_0202398238 /NCGR_PEP_ID=MMETSP1128-20130828/1157_1 /ASSEMBLY_ACC=CAM_ASM_000463 /TAXON_ID=3047 /ORGANISM="Dunaliella tertiolecta, Strain CCMP1320" /LENGTH=133 /DNA_ID=CAMNT_0049001333 /DNA_START=8 /DNA_END=408 /DNA_ORIENTATION=-